jgi:outer membrane protein assembly factor BamB
MTRLRRSYALRALAFAVLALGVSACAGDEEESAERPAQTVPTETQAPQPPPPPPPPEASIKVLDGDTSKPVRGARVRVARDAEGTNRWGTARFVVPRKRAVAVRVSAPGYRARTVRTRLRANRVERIELWRPALQWPMYGANQARTQVHEEIKLRPPFRAVWKRNLHGLVEFPAVVWEGVAYVNNMRGWLRALSMKNGRLLWQKRVGTRMASSPGLDPERRVLVTTSMEPGYVNVVSMDTGRTRWRFYSGRSEPSPLVRNGVAYFGAANGNFYALDLQRRRPRWIFRGGSKITGSPALVGNRLFFGDYAGRVIALNARNGRVLWTGSAGSRVYGTVAVAGGRVFAPSVFSGLSALSARTGRLLWRIPVGVYLYSSPAAWRNRVYFGTYAGVVYSAHARSGRILWSRSAGGRVSGAIQIVAGVVYAASMERRITAWHWRTGREVWRFPQGRYVPVSGNGARLLVHGGGRVWAMVPAKKER